MGRGDTLLVTASSASHVKYNLVMLSNHLSIIICSFNFEDPSAFLKLSNGNFHIVDMLNASGSSSISETA